VVIWDAQNETVTPVTGAAAKMVRSLDLSNRPWENGWSEPMTETDPCESHPYLFIQYVGADREPQKFEEPKEGYKKDFFGKIRRPDNDATNRSTTSNEKGLVFHNPALINEYAWIWLDKKGTPTFLSKKVYDILWDGDKTTPEQRFVIAARNVAMLTEYWRAHRRAAGVSYFSGLGTTPASTDFWADLPNLVCQPEFYKYVRPSFAPVGLMIDLWEKDYPAAAKINVPVYVINDLKTPFAQEVTLTILKENKVVSTYKQAVSAKGYEALVTNFEVTVPKDAGDYQMKAEITLQGELVFSSRDIPVK
jgi:hypothetical protein